MQYGQLWYHTAQNFALLSSHVTLTLEESTNVKQRGCYHKKRYQVKILCSHNSQLQSSIQTILKAAIKQKFDKKKK